MAVRTCPFIVAADAITGKAPKVSQSCRGSTCAFWQTTSGQGQATPTGRCAIAPLADDVEDPVLLR